MRKVRCPHCGKITEFSPENPYRPFCSERCRLIDLGDWASEKYKIPDREDKNLEDLPHRDAEEERED
jgi:endogenous inhibitor of DNA gyrase (YacG/DUF329 family)